MYDYIEETYEDSFLEHHGILGQKWGIRRFQNYDGTLKAAGKRRAKTDRDKERAEKKAAKAQAKAEKKEAKEEEARKNLRSEIDKAIANVDFKKISELKGQMTDDDLLKLSKRAQALGKTAENLDKYKKGLPPSTFDKVIKGLGAVKTGADAVVNAHKAFKDLRKEFGLDVDSILNDNDTSSENKSGSKDEPDIFDRIKETTGKIAKDAAAKANEKYQEHKFQKDLQKVKDEKASAAISEFMNNIDKSGPKKTPAAYSNVDVPSPSLPWATKPLSQRDLNSNKEAGSAISDFMKSVNGSGSKGSSGNSGVDLPPLSLPWSGSVSSKAANTKISDVSKPSPQTQKNIERFIKKGSEVGDVSISQVNDELLKRNNSRLGL